MTDGAWAREGWRTIAGVSNFTEVYSFPKSKTLYMLKNAFI